MKFLTLNTHSHREADFEHKLYALIRFLLREQPDVVGLQEVSQSISAASAETAQPIGFIAAPGSVVPLKKDNHSLRIAEALRESGIKCSWTYLPVKTGYEQYDEGLALLSLSGQLTGIDACTISRAHDYQNWRTRKALSVQLEGRPEWFCTVHMGWWHDDADPFALQWEALCRHLAPLRQTNRVWLLGDFNAPAETRHQGYDLISSSGWYDAYLLADRKDDGITVPGAIDGWREAAAPSHPMRIDQIWCSLPARISSYRTVFNGRSEPAISDHFGILVETGGIQ